MSDNKGSVAPKERVNIVYKPATGDNQDNVELPLKMLVVGDFTSEKDERMLEERKPISIDKDNFNDVLKAQGIKMNFTVPSTIKGSESSDMEVSLKVNNMNDFKPDSIAEQVPELSSMLELRDALKALKSPLSNIPAFRKKIQQLVQDPQKREGLLRELGISTEESSEDITDTE